MRWSLGRLANAAEAVAKAMAITAEGGARSAQLMEDMLTNQARVLEQNDETAARYVASEAESKRHRDSCEEYHKKMTENFSGAAKAWLERISALEARVLELEHKTKEPWK